MTSASFDIIQGLLRGEHEIPRKYQDPALETRTDVAHPYYFVRVFVSHVTLKGIVRKREVKKLGYVGDINKRKAEQLRAKLLEQVNAGRLVVQSQILMRDLIARFIDIRVPQLGDATQAKYRTQIKNHILPAFGEMKLAEIDRAAVEAFLTAKAEAGLGWWSRIDLKGVLSAIFTAAKLWKLWEGDNPTANVRIGRKKEVREKRLLSADDMRRLLTALHGDVRLIVLIIFGTGLRISEVLGLQWRDIDLAAGTLTVARRWYRGNVDEPKTEASKRTRQIGPLADELLVRGQARDKGRNTCTLAVGGSPASQYIFTGDGSRTPPDERDLLRYVLRPTLKRLGLYYNGFGWHAFRRQNISWKQTVGGATPFEAQKGAGHASLDMTFSYSLNDVERERDQVARMFEHLIGTEATKQ